mmetsp:Transcript_59287/g.162663  ORF Transcript_59287/g.162663 Transcript_59287/m.162663 type:complete len:258 (-) Transcript_59287:96-869(-)
MTRCLEEVGSHRAAQRLVQRRVRVLALGVRQLRRLRARRIRLGALPPRLVRLAARLRVPLGERVLQLVVRSRVAGRLLRRPLSQRVLQLVDVSAHQIVEHFDGLPPPLGAAARSVGRSFARLPDEIVDGATVQSYVLGRHGVVAVIRLVGGSSGSPSGSSGLPDGGGGRIGYGWTGGPHALHLPDPCAAHWAFILVGCVGAHPTVDARCAECVGAPEERRAAARAELIGADRARCVRLNVGVILLGHRARKITASRS